MRHLKTNKVLFSVDQASRSAIANATNHEYALNLLEKQGIAFRVMEGFYKGIAELSIMLESTDAVTHERNFGIALELARMYNQESILEIHNDDSALLYYLSQGIRSESIGKLREVSSVEGVSSYTRDPETGRYFVVD